MSTSWSGAVVFGAGISGCLAALSLSSQLDDVAIVAGSGRGRRIDFPMTVGAGLVQRLRDLALCDAWDAWAGKVPLDTQWSAWGEPDLERRLALIPGELRYLVGRCGLERFLRTLALGRGVRLCRTAPSRPSATSVVVDASGRSGLIARRRGAKRRTVSKLVAVHGTSDGGGLRDRSIAVQSAADGWWVALRAHGRASVMYVSSREAPDGRGHDHRLRVPDPPRAFGQLVGPTRFAREASLASMSWLEGAGSANCFAVGDAALALDPIQGSGVDVAAETARLLGEAVAASNPVGFYNEAIDRLVARHRIARQHVYQRAAAAHDGAFWTRQLEL